MNETWQALAREVLLGAEYLAMGVSLLGKANYAQYAYYGQAFFSLTTSGIPHVCGDEPEK